MFSKEDFFVDKIHLNAIGGNADLLIYHPQELIPMLRALDWE